MRLSIPLLVVLALIPAIAPAQLPFEKILVPFDTTIQETGGARWLAELWVRNDASTPVNLFPEQCFFIGLQVPCNRRIDVPAATTKLLDVQSDRPESPGLYVYVPSTHADDIHFSLRVRDLALGSDQIGTEIPVARASDVRPGRRTFLNVPLQPRSRITLRLYSSRGNLGSAFTVRVFAEPTGDLLAERTFLQIGPTDPPVPDVTPMVINANAVFEGWIADRVRVTVEGNAPYWPLLTITNTRNQQVTVVRPSP